MERYTPFAQKDGYGALKGPFREGHLCYICQEPGDMYHQFWVGNTNLENAVKKVNTLFGKCGLKIEIDDLKSGVISINTCSEHVLNLEKLMKSTKEAGEMINHMLIAESLH